MEIMIKRQKYIFLYALILTFVVFNIGIFMGYMLEHSRATKVNKLYLESEMELLDQRIQKDALETVGLDCEYLVKENIEFGDKIFEEALEIQKYEEANQINDDVIFQHKRFDLLRTLFWMNSIRIKEACNSSFHNIVYIYKYNDPSIEQKSKQRFLSNLLTEIKNNYADEVMLIPIAGDNGISSIDLLMKRYNITELPTVLIDEEFKVTEINSKEDVEEYLE